MAPLLLSAVLALSAVAVADRVEQGLVAPAAPASAVVDATSADAASALGAASPNPSPFTETPLRSAALPAGEMVLTFADGSAAISTGANDPIFELGTTTIGDVDLSGVEPVLAQGDAEVSADWGEVTEWYRPAGDGIEHGYTVDEPVSTGDELTVTVDVVAGEPTLVHSQNVAIERSDGSTVWYRGLVAFDANGTDLSAQMAVVDGDIELRIDTGGAEYPITIDPTISELQKLFTDPDAAGDWFGESVAIDGVPGDMTIVVGAVGDDGEQGAAYVFRDEGFGWVQAAKLLPPTPGDRQFGWDVDVRGDVVVVGAPGDDANGPDAGAVYVFEPAGPFEPWQQTSVVYQCDPSVVSPCGETPAGAGFDGAGFGFSVDLTDQFLLVGAPGFQSSQGGAWVYQRSGNDWQTSTAGVLGRTGFAPGIDGPPAAGDEFGYAVAAADAGTHIVVGAPGDDNFVGIDAGRTFYFQWDGSALSAPVLLTSGNTADGNTGASVEVEIDAQGDAWMFSGAPVNTRFEDGTEPGVSYSWRYVLPEGAAPIDANLINYGSSAATPAQAAFTGAHVVYADSFADSSATDAGSAVYVPVLPDADPAFNRLGTGLYPSLPANAGDRWGFDVAATGDTYVIGGPGNDAAGTDAGEVRIGSFSSFGALEVLSPDPSFDPARLGTAVAVDGDRMVASAPFESAGASGAGVVYVYERANASTPWELATSIPSPDPEFDGGFGDSLDLRGPLLAIGESDRFGDGAEPGRVWVYAFTGSSWELQGPALEPAILGAENGDQFGASLAWVDGTILAIGAPGAGGSAGRVALVNDTGAGWNITDVTMPVGVAPVSGDQFGFDIAAGDGDLSGSNLFVGAPGRDDAGLDGGAVYRFGVVEGDATWTNSFGYATGERVGTAVDTSGDRAVAAGYGGGTLAVQILEYIPNPDPLDTDRPFVWNGDGGVSVGVGFIPEDGPINDYVALDGTTMAVGRPGGGGSVAVFQRGASGWPTVPDIEIVPAGRRPGDRIGHAIALDGATLVIGAPGDSGVTLEFPNSGAVHALDLAALGEITGVVLDPGGVPVAGALVALGSLGVSVLTGSDGSFALGNLPIGEYELSVVPPAGSGLAIEYYPDSFDLANAVPVSTQAGVPLTINLNQVGTVSGVLTDAEGSPLEGVDIFAPQFVVGIGWVQDGPAGVTGAGGVYSLELAPGRWAVCANPDFGSGLLGDCVPEGWTTNTPEGDGLLVTEGGSISDVDLQFTVDDRALINVTLLDEFGAPATGNLRVLAACTPPANPVLSAALCSAGPSGSPAQFSPPAPFDQFSVRLPAGAYNVAAIVSPDGGATGQISGQTSLTVADGEEFDCTFTMNGAASCVDVTPRTPYNPITDIDADVAVVAVPSQGEVFVLERIAGVWTDVQTIQSPDPGYSEFGASVTLALPYLAIGAPDSDAVEVYEFTGTQFDPLRTYNGPAGSRFGESVSAAAGRLAVGAPLYDDTRTDVGAVDLFVLATASTVPESRLSDGADGDLFGSTVELTDADLWIAALGDDGPTDTEPDTGVVRRYDSGGNFANLEVRAAGVGTGSTISAVDGRAAIATTVSTDVVVFDTGIGVRTLSGVSTGFGNQLAMTAAGERLYVADEGTGETFVYDRSPLSGLFAQSATLPSVDPSVVTSLAADGALVVRGLSGTGPLSSGLGAATFDVVALPEVPIDLDFELALGVDAPSSLAVAPLGIAVNSLDRNAVAKSGGTSSNIAGSSITAIGPEDTSLASISLGATPLRAVVLESDVLSAIPLVNIDIDGGWDRIIALSDALRREPLSSLTFGQVLAEGDPQDSQSPAGVLAATPLRAVNVDGTPLRAVSLAAIALGSTPLRAVPLRAVAAGEPNPWCEFLGAELLAQYPVGGCEEAIDDLSLLEATLRGASIDAAPLRAVPLRAVDVAESPLRAVLLEDIALGASPLGAIPLRAVPLRAVELAASPLRAVPLRAVPLRAVPVSTIDLDQDVSLDPSGPSATPLRAVEINESPLRAVTTSITLDAAPLRAVDADGTPVSAIQVEGAPLRAVPLTAVMLADVPLRAVPLDGNETFDWCAVLADVGDGFDCDNGVDLDVTTVGDLSIRGVPLRAVPLRAVPLRAVLQDATIGSIPLRAVPLRAVPLRAVPLGGLSASALDSIEVNGSPLRAVPLRAVDLQGTALGTIPLRAVAPGAIPLRAVPLRAVPLRAVPLRAVPLRAVDLAGTLLADTPLRAVDVLGSPLRAVPLRAVDPQLLDCDAVDCERGTLGDALLRGAISLDVTLEQIQGATENIDLADLVAALDGVDAGDLLAAFEAAGLTLEDLLTLDGLTLGDLPNGILELDDVQLGALLNGLTVGTFADLVDAIIDPATGEPVAGLEQQLLDAIASLNLLLGDLERLGDVTLGDILDGTHPITLADIEPVLRFVTLDEFERALNITVDRGLLTLGELADLAPEKLGQLTLADLSTLVSEPGDAKVDIADLLEALGLADLIDGFTLGDLLLALVDPASLTYGGVDFADVDVTALPPGTVGTTTFDASFTLTASTARNIELQIQVPRSAGYVTGTGRISGDGVTNPIEPARFGSVLTWSFVAQPGVPYAITFDILPTLTLGSTSLSAVARVVGTDISVPASAGVSVVEGTEPNDFTRVSETTKAAEDTVYLTYIADPTDIDVFEITVAEDDELVVELSNLDADLDLALWGRNETEGASLAPSSSEAPLFAVKDPDAGSGVAEPLDDFPQLNEVDPTLGLIDVSNSVGTQNETLESGRLNAGTYYIQVVGANGATNVQPAALQLKVLEADERPECLPLSLPTFSGTVATAPDLSGADTLLLINERRLEQLHGAGARADVRAAADRLVAAAQADPSLGISPVVVPVDAYDAVQRAYDAWDSAGGSCDPDAANAVVAAINSSIIDPVREDLTHVVILGPDELIPMARLADETEIANEYDYRHEFDGDLPGVTQAERNGRNAFTSVAWESSILSDDPYGESAARSLGDRYLYVTDLALGRVVESPAEIVDALDTYVSFDGTLDIDTATVLGYDFLADGSAEIADILDDTLPVDDELALGPDPSTGDGWTAAGATDKLAEASTRALVSLNAHFDHYRSLPAIGDKVVGFDDNLIAATVRDELRNRLALDEPLAQSLIFSMGCHSGLSVSDITISRTNQDWAQTLGQQGSLFVGNTGFGYGDTKTVAYTEKLMALFAAQVTAPFDTGDGSTTVGQALAWAKNEFVAGLQTFSVYDEKAVQESTFYGLPFYRVGLDAEPLPLAPATVTVRDATDTASVSVTVDATNGPVDDGSGDGIYFANTDAAGNELVIVAPGQPIQPKIVEDVTVVDPTRTTKLGEIARGAIVLDMESTYQSLPNPVIATPIFDESASQPEPSLTTGVFPTKPLSITTTTGPAGERQQLVLATGQYRADDGVQRLDDDIDVVVYYADPANPDVTAPLVGAVSANIAGGSLTVSLTAGVEPGDGVDRVYLLVAENPTVSASVVDWKGLDLTRTPGTNRWTGSLLLTPGTNDVEFIVQAKDPAGNVGFATNKARNFGEVASAPVPPPPPPPPADQLSVTVPTPPESGWFDGSVEIVIAAAATPASVFVNGVQRPGTLEAGQTFTIDADGVQNWTVVTEAGRTTSGTVRVDADGDPRVVLGVPSGTGIPVYPTGTRRVDVICRDTSLVSCALTIDGQTVANGDPLPTALGEYTLGYTAIDQIGRETTGTAPFRIAAVVATPVITSPGIPTDPQPIAGDVSIDARFTDASMPFDTFSAAVDWGDGQGPLPATVTPPTGTTPGIIAASRPYTETGQYTVTLTVTDGTGTSATSTSTVVVYDPGAAPDIGSVVAPTGDRPIVSPVEVSASFSDRSIPVDSFTATIDWGDGTVDDVDVTDPTFDSDGGITGSHVYTMPGSYQVVVSVLDGTGQSDSDATTVTVVAPTGAPMITGISGPGTPLLLTDTVTVDAVFSDASAPYDTFDAVVDWGDGTTSPATITPPTTATGEGAVTATHVYTTTGVYPVEITITDALGGFDSEVFEFVVVYDPTINGRVNGSGFYWSGAEASAGTSRWGAPAFFGYDAKYKKNATVPSGETKLRLLGQFFFRSTQYDYLIVNDAMAIAEGTGTIGSGSEYRFRVQGIDNGWLDFFQITIWDPTTDEVLYDNGVLYDKGDVVLLGGIKVKGG